MVEPSFDRAVWDHVAQDVKSGMRSWLRLALELMLTGAVTLQLRLWFVGRDAMSDSWVEAILAVPLVLAFLILIHVMWSWATASRRIYDSLVRRLDEQAGLTHDEAQAQADDLSQQQFLHDLVRCIESLKRLLTEGKVKHNKASTGRADEVQVKKPAFCKTFKAEVSAEVDALARKWPTRLVSLDRTAMQAATTYETIRDAAELDLTVLQSIRRRVETSR